VISADIGYLPHFGKENMDFVLTYILTALQTPEENLRRICTSSWTASTYKIFKFLEDRFQPVPQMINSWFMASIGV